MWEPNPLIIPEDLCFLSGKYVDDYLHDVRICQDFAVQNRELIVEKILDTIKTTPVDFFHTVHNYVDVMKPVYNFKAKH